MSNGKVIIIGGGVSGLTSGIYLRGNGYDTVIIDLNHTLGGACTGWVRKGCYIDGCIHWLTGTNTNSSYNELWTDTHAILPNTDIYVQEDFSVFDFGGGKKITIWADIDKLENELLTFAPEDAKEIKKFCKMIRRFQTIEGPVDKPVDMMGLGQLIYIGLAMVGDYYWANKTAKIDAAEYGKRFTNKYIRKIFETYMAPGYNLMSMLYMLAHVTDKNGGIPIGGSKAMADRMAAYYTSLGGKAMLGKEVEEVLIDSGRAYGVRLKSGEIIRADWVVSATPVETCLKKLLKDQYKVKSIEERLADINKYPIYTFSTVAFKVSEDLSNRPLGRHVFLDKPIELDKAYDGITFRNYSYDKTMMRPKGTSVLQASLMGNDDMYFYWKKFKEDGSYREQKEKFGRIMQSAVEEICPELRGKLEIIDIITPCTYERYLHSRNGSFQGFIHTSRGKSLMQKGTIKGLEGFILSGQCIFYSGGLPPAAITGRFAAQRICKADGVKFISPSKEGFRIPDALRRKSIQ